MGYLHVYCEVNGVSRSNIDVSGGGNASIANEICESRLPKHAEARELSR